MNYVLASGSERRQELLHRIVDEFNIIVSDFDEDKILFKGNVDEYVVDLAKGKALSVKESLKEEAIIIAGDTVVVLDDKILGKPNNEEDAYNMLKQLSGRTHRVYSGLVVINMYNNKIEQESLYTEVKFSNLTEEEIESYIKTGEPLDKAGAYGIQGYGGVFIEGINGCYYNVVGLPLNLLNKMLRKVK
ncbi:Maf-like protein [Clostridium tertium]|uniref:Maf-like protein n=1 Tax=Clostridium TaxID=1485 RepID=UPI0011584410|nr:MULTISPECIES: Maf-like protein [Clostridium]MBP1867684.1 septum formation protein [Clostridium tertium]MBS5307313.1 Maf-like protein [Clostridium sp.]MBS5884773.1 Maf-like protein [Clostridium sp.]MDB1921522.1 Maf-like protein [Clostridium tertium]MDB1924766.1 Maf-like protein [Clostridium tertium]